MAARNDYIVTLWGGVPFDPRVLLIPITLGVFGLFCVIDLSFLSATISADSNMILDELWLAVQGTGGGSHYVTALVFHAIPQALLTPFVFTIGAVYILLIYGRNAHPGTLLLCGLLLLPALLFLPRPSKEILLSPVTFLVLGLLCLRIGGLGRVLAVAACYLAYAYTVREYFVIIAAVFAVLMLLAALPWRWGLLLCLLGLAGLSFAPPLLFELLQGPRDAVNLVRMAVMTVGTQSAFMNPLPPDSLPNFIYNYGYALLRLNLPVFFQIRPQEIFLLTVVVTTFSLVGFGLRHGGPKERACALLVLAHALTLALFEPDLGSYLRHLTSATLYLAPVLALLDRHLTRPGSADAPQPQGGRRPPGLSEPPSEPVHSAS